MKTLRVTSAEHNPVPTPSTSKSSLKNNNNNSDIQINNNNNSNKQIGKLLELTPLWEQVTRTGQIPPDTDTTLVFSELGSRLRDPEWEVRQHGLRVLSDLVPVLGGRRLDACLPAVLSELISNLGHPSAAVRKGASDTLRTCIRESTVPDSVLRAIIARTNNEDRNVCMGVIIYIPMLLDDRISQHTLQIIIGSLAKKLIQVSFQEQALKSLVRIRDSVGEHEFSKFLQKYHSQCKQDFDILCQVYEIGEYLSDSGIDLQYPVSGPPQGWGEDVPEYNNYGGPSSSSASSRSRSVDDYESSEGESSEKFNRDAGSRMDQSNRMDAGSRMDQSNRMDAGGRMDQSSRMEAGNRMESTKRMDSALRMEHNKETEASNRDETSASTSGTSSARPKSSRPKSGKSISRPTSSRPQSGRPQSGRPQSGRVVMETEIKFNEKTAITMTILEEEKDGSSGDEQEDNFEKNDNEEEDDGMFIRGSAPQRKENTRRVRFGGEEVLKTPPSSAKAHEFIENSNSSQESEKETHEEKPIEKSMSDDKIILKPSLIPVRIPTDRGPHIKPVKNISKIDYKTKPLIVTYPTKYDYSQLNGKNEININPDLITDIQNSNKPDILITETEIKNQEIKKDNGNTEEKKSSRGNKKRRPESPIPSIDGGDSLTGSSSDFDHEVPSPRDPVVEQERVESALVSLEELESTAGQAASSWEDLRIVDDSVMDDLKDRDDWRARVRGAQQLKAALRNSAAIERLRAHIPEFLTFLESMLEDQNPRVVAATLGTYARLAEALGTRLRPHARHMAGALCRPAASARAEVKLECAHAAKAVMQALGVKQVTEALAEHVRARNHRHREVALQLVILGLLTFPSSEFDMPELARRVLPALADSKRRVRQAALDCTAVLGQYIHPSALPVHLASERLRSKQSQDALDAAVNARLSRRSLPALSPEGLILYSVQVPNHAARGTPGVPAGADVEWILAGSGSTSPGSARSRAQLFSATRRGSSEDSLPEHVTTLPGKIPTPVRNHRETRSARHGGDDEIKTVPQPTSHVPSTPLSMTPSMLSNSTPDLSDQLTWTLMPVGALQDGLATNQGPLWTAEIASDPGAEGFNRPMYLRLLRRQPEQISNLDKDRGYILLPSKQLANTLGRSQEAISPYPQDPVRSPSPALRGGRRVLEPMRSPDLQGMLEHREERTSPIPLRPTLARSSSSERRKMMASRDTMSPGSSEHESESVELSRQRSASLRRSRQRERRERNMSDPTGGGMLSSPLPTNPNSPRGGMDSPRRSTPPHSPALDGNPIPQKPVLARNLNNNVGLRRVSVSSPRLDKSHDDVSMVEVVPIDVALGLLGTSSRPSSTDGRRRFFPSVDSTPPALGSPPARNTTYFPPPPHVTPSHSRSSLLPQRGNFFSKPETPPPRSPMFEQSVHQSQAMADEEPRHVSTTSLQSSKPDSPPLHAVRRPLSPPLHVSLPASLLDAAVHSPLVNNKPLPTSMLEGVEDDVTSPLSGGVVARALPPRARPARKTGPHALRRGKSSSLTRINSSSASSSSSVWDEQTSPLRRPQEALTQCQLQLGSQDWEKVVQGLQLLVRLTRHHPDVVSNNLHSVVNDLVRQVRNLRSQVSRAACTAAGELAVALKRGIENELEELMSPLLHRTADTNKFIREDCGRALDKIMENISPVKTIPAIISQGASHKSGVVRATTARLLAQSVVRMGAEKVLTTQFLRDDVRCKLLRTAASFLTEGSLETRTWSKKLFETLMAHEAFESTLEQNIPHTLMLTIKKPLYDLRKQLKH